MFGRRWQFVPLVLLAAGVMLAWASAYMAAERWTLWHVGIVLGGLLALGVAGWLQQRKSTTEQELERIRAEIQREQKKLERQRRKLKAAQLQSDKLLENYLHRMDRREQKLAARLTTLQEWQEFTPQPINLAHEVTDEELSELARRDREMMKLLSQEAERLFNNVLENKYSPNGSFQGTLLRDDIYLLAERVARLYQPDSEHPLLETSLVQILRSLSRASLHLLTVLDQLPLNVKEYSIKRMYGYVRQAVKAYGYYKAAEPYWPYASSAWYLSRLAMGANPATLGAWWFLNALGTRGARVLTERVVNRQALTLIHNLVRVVGYEVASIYGGDFRHRDPNWVYAAELTELVSRFPLTHSSLSHALKEISALELRNEYDRIFLYRCLAEHVSAGPERYRALHCLTAQERLAVARRLEQFLQKYITDQQSASVEHWEREVEERLGVGMSRVRSAVEIPRDDAEGGVRSLASFAVAVKQREPEELPDLLQACRLVQRLTPARREAVFEHLRAVPPYFFEQPDLDPQHELVDIYLSDLVLLDVTISPRSQDADEVLGEVAVFLRRDPDTLAKLVDKHYVDQLSKRLAAEAPQKRLPPDAARAILDVAEPHEAIRFVYPDVRLRWSEGLPHGSAGRLYLVGMPDRLVLLGIEGSPQVLWRADGRVNFQRLRRRLTSELLLEGGQWLADPETAPPTLLIPGVLLSSYQGYFGPLLSYCAEVRERS